MWHGVMAELSTFRSLTIVVDGFDEMERECQQGSLDCLAKFQPPDDAKRLRVLLLSCEDQEADTQVDRYEIPDLQDEARGYSAKRSKDYYGGSELPAKPHEAYRPGRVHQW